MRRLLAAGVLCPAALAGGAPAVAVAAAAERPGASVAAEGLDAAGAASATAERLAVRAGSLRAVITPRPWRLRFLDPRGREVLAGRRLGLRAADGWRYATRVLSSRGVGGTFTATLATTDRSGHRLLVRLAPGGEGTIGVSAVVRGARADVSAVGASFTARRGERYLGFGERSNAVDQRGRVVVNRVEEGPFLPAEYDIVAASIPPWALRRAPDASYFPIPWLLSTRGYGALVGNDEPSRFDLRGRRAWRVEVEARRLDLRVYAGPRPAGALRRMTAAVGRQPPAVAPWQWGPWFQTGHENENPAEPGYVDILRRADAPVSAVETHMRYMPCAADRPRAAAERARTAAFHAAGLAALTYTREAVCRDAPADFAPGLAAGAFLTRRDGRPAVFSAFVGGRVTDIAQIDPTARAGRDHYAAIVSRAVANGYDGWMEDYGEYAPPDAVAADGTAAPALQNRYPVLYHAMAHAFARAQRRPLVRFQRSGWTGATSDAQAVWGGDPTTGWGFDGLTSSVRQALTMGLSGVSTWGSDVGGFFTLGEQRLTPELLARWIQFGAVSGLMRTKAQGIGPPLEDRPQIWEQPTLPVWRRYAKLRTQLYPYLVAADAAYRRTGMPIMRHLALAFPGDARAARRDDQFLFGPDVLAAPVLGPGRRRRTLYLPQGTWVDLWRSARYVARDGSLRAGPARLVRGGRERTLPAPLDELPLMVRAGAVLPLLPPEVDTLAGFGTLRGLVRWRDRRDRVRVVAFARGRRVAGMLERESVVSREGRGSWELEVRGTRGRRYVLQATLSTLRRPFVPCRAALDGRSLRPSAWSYDSATRVLRAAFDTTRGRLVVERCSRGR